MKTKKIIAALLAVIMLISAFGVTFASALALPDGYEIADGSAEIAGEIYGYIGDADGDSEVNIKDATEIQKAVAKIVELGDKNAALADVDMDADVTIKDATAIQKWIAQISVDAPVGSVVYLPDEPVPSTPDETTVPTQSAATVPTQTETQPQTQSQIQTTTAIITQPTTTEPGKDPSKQTDPFMDVVSIYFTDVLEWGNVNVYFWGSLVDGGNWPGKAMRLCGQNAYGQEVFAYDVPVDVDGIIFNNGLEGSRNQTVDITEGVKKNAGFYVTEQDTDDKWMVDTFLFDENTTIVTNPLTQGGTTEPVTDPIYTTPVPTTTQPKETDPIESTVAFDTLKVYFTNIYKWDLVNIHYWGAEETSWPGVPMTLVQENEYGYKTYMAELPKGTAGIVVNCFTEAGGTPDMQTTDIDVSGLTGVAGYYPSGFTAEGKLAVGTFEPTV